MKQNLTHLLATGEATPLPRARTVEELRDIAAHAYDGREDEPFKSIRWIEFLPLWLLRLRSTRGTALAPVVRALALAGVPIQPRLGSVMDVLGFDRNQLHTTACYCHHAMTDGRTIAKYLRNGGRTYVA